MASRFVGRNNTGVSIGTTPQALAQLAEGLRALAGREVLVGVPEENGAREEKGEPTNAQLAYIHDNGAPEANIPRREFMRPGVDAARPEIERILTGTMRKVLRGGGEDAAEVGLERAGAAAASSIKNTIDDGVPPPLSDRTLRQRLKKGRKNGAGAREGAAIELDRRWDGQAPSVEHAKPLVDTGQLRNSITYVVRPKRRRRT